MDAPHQQYAAIVARQLAALQADDLAALDALAEQRQALAPAVAALPPLPEVLEALRAAAALDRQLCADLTRRRAALLGEVHQEQQTTPRLRAYARAAQVLTPRSVDLSL